MLWSPSIIKPSLQDIGLRLLRLFYICHQTVNPYTNECTFLLLLVKGLLVLTVLVCQPKHNESIPYNRWIHAHSLLHMDSVVACSLIRAGLILRNQTSQYTHSNMDFWTRKNCRYNSHSGVSTWNTNPCEHFDSTVHKELRNHHANTKGVF